MQIERAANRYVLAESRAPDAKWYVVNQQVGSDPAERPRPLASNPVEVATFAADGGLVIDTADLFRLREAVRAEQISVDKARELLKTQAGIFTPPLWEPG